MIIDADNLVQASINLALAKFLQAPIAGGDMMPKKSYVKYACDDEAYCRDHPDEQCKQHPQEYGCLLAISCCQDLQVVEKLHRRVSTVAGSMLPSRDQIKLHDRVEGEGVDDVSWTFCKYNAHPCCGELV